MKSVGDISDLVETLDGYEIIKLTGLKEARQKPFGEVKGQIIAKDRFRRIDRFWNAFAAKLRNEAKVVWSPQELKRKAEWNRKMATGASATSNGPSAVELK